jgi:cellobiose phosphorylase
MLEPNRQPGFRRLLPRPAWLRRSHPEHPATAADAALRAAEDPLRAELMSIEQLRRHFRSLAEWHRVREGRMRSDPLLERLDENEAVLADVQQRISAAAVAKRRLAPAAEWLLDNYYLIEEQIRIARRHFPRSYDRELPKLSNGPLAGYARAYVLAFQLILHVDGRVDAGSLAAAIGAYQEVAPLKLGELWAIPIMLRLALIENLRRVAARVASGRQHGDRADEWAARLLELAESRPTALVEGLADLSRSMRTLSGAFVADLSRSIQGRHPGMALVLSWLEQRLGEHGANVEQLVQAESQAQAADQVSVGHSIVSLRFLSAMDWREFVEGQSTVEHELRGDPADVYSDMDFATRDRYRHQVERIARRSPLSEREAAAMAVALASRAPSENGDARRRHVGWWLIGNGTRELERACSMRRPLRASLGSLLKANALGAYLLGVVVVCVLAGWAAWSWIGMPLPLWALIAVAVLAGLACSSAAVSLANWFGAVLVVPQPMPRLDYTEGIPPDRRALVAVPCMLSNERAIDELLEALEVRWVANRDDNLGLALLSDHTDASERTLPRDSELLERARAGIEALNRRYGDEERPAVFHLLHRERVWSAREHRWMGRERKRGKLEELVRALRATFGDGPPPGFDAFVGDLGWLTRVKYLIVLDADTQLPMDSARRLVGTMAHPLNRPRYDDRRMVVGGHGLVQPRVAVTLPSAGRSRYARLSAPDPGIDPYTRAVSDAYQDLFDQGSFVGKGILDVDAFTRALDGRMPPERVLSHDLLEGCYVRSGLSSDTLLFEDTPARYLADVARRHRWVRGDWQVAPWLLPRVRTASGTERNPLSALSRWKILDNLRRSLVPAALVGLIGCGCLLSAPPLVALALMAMTLPAALSLARELGGRAVDMPLRVHLRRVAASAARQSGWVGAQLATLAHETCWTLDAATRAVWRMVISHRRLLEWKTAAEAEREAATGLAATCVGMASSPLLAIGLGTAAVAAGGAAPGIAAPFVMLWLLAPGLAWWSSRPLAEAAAPLDLADQRWLRSRARRTWRWFESFVIAEHHWLPPDNHQEHPVAVTAPRTSPTNIGIALLSELGACDFGYLTPGALLERLERTRSTISRLERYRGHLYNWYDTHTLQPLSPRYVSSVDSGNFCGHLLVLARGLDELGAKPILPISAVDGLGDALRLYADAAPPRAAATVKRVERAIDEHHLSLHTTHAWIGSLRAAARELRLLASSDEAVWWAAAFEEQRRRWEEELLHLAPWLQVGEPPVDAVGAARLRAELSPLEGEPPTLARLALLDRELAPRLDALAEGAPEPLRRWLAATRVQLGEGARRARERLASLAELSAHAREAAVVDFTFLYDRSRDLFAIGYQVSDHRLDQACYDLLASEARLASYIAVAQGHVKQEHWFALGRLLTAQDGEPALLSWSGSMFEYLMPLLVMPDYQHTLLHRTYRAVLARQMSFGRERGVPWGISESGYNATDAQLNYQYRAFGVPGLGLKRGLGDDLVITPYASALALMVDPRPACANLRRLSEEGREGPYGWIEAVDYTPSRLPPGQDCAPVRSWMAHHQGMTFLSLLHSLLDQPMQRRFLAEPLFRASELLLHEKVPRAQAPIFPHVDDSAPRRGGGGPEPALRVVPRPDPAQPEVHLLSNGRYHVMVSAAGGGYSRWRDLALTRWREDWTRDSYGLFCYLRDRESGEWFSAAHQPSLRPAKSYEAVFLQGRAEFKRADEGLETRVEIAVSPEDDVEVRRITVVNAGDATRVIEATTYAEVVLAPAAQDLAHPAFSNLFVTTESLPGQDAILCTRRARSPGEKPPWLFHLMVLEGAEDGAPSFETSRAAFIGRARSPADPAAMSLERLSGAVGSVLDPVIAVRRAARIAPDTMVRFDIVTGAAETRERALELVEKYRERRMAERVFELAWTHSQVVLRQLDADEPAAQRWARLAGAVIYPTAARRAPPALLAANRRGQPGLWAHGISGDLPIVLMRLGDAARLPLVGELARAHAYWRAKGLACDLVVLVEERSLYRQALHEQVQSLVAGVPGAALDHPGGIFVRRHEQLAEEDRVLLQAAARVVLDDSAPLTEQLERRPRADPMPPRLASRVRPRELPPPPPPAERELAFANGVGGFTPDGREYVITLREGEATPAPWCNVIANPIFGTVVDEGGSGYTWADNCHEFRLTEWRNDAVAGGGGEALWLRDDDGGAVWSPTPWPARGRGAYVVRHGFGYSAFEHEQDGIATEAMVYVAIDAPVKFTVVRVRNRSGRDRRLSLAMCCDLVLGDLRARNAPHIVTALSGSRGALVATNAYSAEFAGRAVFIDCSEPDRSATGDRLEFLGRNSDPTRPAALGRLRLSNRAGAGLDPCAAMMTSLELADGQEREVVFVLGAGRDADDARALAERWRSPAAARAALEAVWAAWKRTLGVIHLETPERSLDVLANGWLLYQAIACRVWARSGFYQSGGAFGFRDQLQDALALLHTAAPQVREHLLRCAARQFEDGDVLHWWHPPQDRGVRTHFSDDFLWLPYVVCRYVDATADTGVLEERVAFLEGRKLLPEEEARYDTWPRSSRDATLWDHCLRAVRHGLRFGAHGLPLMGCGDWNDGMNRVGAEGRGESVWLAFFLCDVLTRMSRRAEARGEAPVSTEFAEARKRLEQAIAEHAWDGEWYRRAYFDDGRPLGSREDPECQIDSLPQSWAVLAGVGERERALRGMNAVYLRLVDRVHSLIKLFDPPFDRSTLEPGYIKGYVPGVRENGGQYTHAAIWAAMAYAEMGDHERAWELVRIIDPVRHGDDPGRIARYAVEPYVVAADVYAVPGIEGRGGWTWYSGSAGWLYRLIVETLAGIELRGGRLAFAPRPPAAWNGYKVHYRAGDTFYHIEFARGARARVELDGEEQPDGTIPLADDRREHAVRVEFV